MPREVFPDEKRVAQTPSTVALLVKKGFKVVVEKGAGEAASFSDAQYEEAGATVVPEAWSQADLVLKIHPPTEGEAALLEDRAIISMLAPRQNEDLVAT